MGPGLLAEHLVALQAGLVHLAEGVARPPHAHILHEAEVAHLVAHQRVCEDVGCLLVIGLDAPEDRHKEEVTGSDREISVFQIPHVRQQRTMSVSMCVCVCLIDT